METNSWYPRVVGRLFEFSKNGQIQMDKNPRHISGFRKRFYTITGLLVLMVARILDQTLRKGMGLLDCLNIIMMQGLSLFLTASYHMKIKDPEDYVILLNGFQQLELSLAGNGNLKNCTALYERTSTVNLHIGSCLGNAESEIGI